MKPRNRNGRDATKVPSKKQASPQPDAASGKTTGNHTRENPESIPLSPSPITNEAHNDDLLIALRQLDNEAARPLFIEWLHSVPREVLRNLICSFTENGIPALVLRNDLESELTDAVRQAHALDALMQHRVLVPDDGGEYCGSIQCGIVQLSLETFNRLERAARAMARGAR